MIELLIAVAVIGVIAVIAIPNYLDMVRRAKEATAIAYMRQWITAQEQYKMRNGSYAEDLDDLIGAGLLLPADQRIGYQFEIEEEEEEGRGWSGNGTPGVKSWRHFYTDGTGTIRYESGKKADEESPPV